ncbi:MAG TPA: flagellar hook-associated protein FlgK [Pseudolabrys sp.]|nr:flagellar hook-associated protein FlgK [Pseudolabrys sp.]
MSLTEALTTSLTGLNAAQTGLSLVASNVANAQTPGYVRKTVSLVNSSVGTTGGGVQVASINRVLDRFVQAQLRTESAGGGYADLRAQMYEQLQNLYGAPGSTNTLESSFNAFTTALQALTTSPGDRPTQVAVISAAQTLAQQLNGMSAGIQSLRSQAELGLADDVSQANTALQQIAQLNQQLGASQSDSATAALEDQRDSYIAQLSKLMDIRVIAGDHNQVTVFTTSGVQLVGAQASTLSFDAQGTMAPQAQWSADPTKRTVGTITLTAPNGGGTTDLLATNSIRSGEIAAYVDMRDRTLVQAQTQLDQFAAAMASALSDHTTAGTAIVSGAQSGFDIDIGSLSAGNSVSLTYTDNGTGTQHAVTFVRVDDPSVLPLSNSATTNPDDTVVGIDFSGGVASVVSQINAALAGTGVSASNPSGTTLRLLDDGAANTADVNAVSATVTATSLSGGIELPFFIDGATPYTGAITASGLQSTGLASRIAVNSALAADPTQLVAYQSGAASGDGTRPNFIYDQLANASHAYAPSSGIGTSAAPFSGTAGAFLRQVISLQGQAASNAASLKQGQDVVVSALQQRYDATSGVNIDQEMSDLLNLQNAYAANARVMSTVKDMLAELMQLGN